MEASGRRIAIRIYEVVLAISAGFSVGFFTWVLTDRAIQSLRLALWPFATAGVLAISAAVFWARRTPNQGRWVHMLWVPVGVFVVLMTLVVMALRRLT